MLDAWFLNVHMVYTYTKIQDVKFVNIRDTDDNKSSMDGMRMSIFEIRYFSDIDSMIHSV